MPRNSGATTASRASAVEIAENPYLIAEMYCGADASDRVPWSAIDRGVLPSPELGGKPLADVEFNDERRLRALCVGAFAPRAEAQLSLGQGAAGRDRAAHGPATRLEAGGSSASATSRWTPIYLSGALALRPTDLGLAVYLKSVFEDERLVESHDRTSACRGPRSTLRRPVTAADWSSWVFKSR